VQVLLNKAALSSFHFQSANALLFFQCLLSLTLVNACAALGLIQLEPFNPKIVRAW
jgi:hypothetical protein